MEDDCIFCEITEGEVPSHKVYEDENVIAFLDTNPVSKGHTLVVPKEHVDDIFGAEQMDYMWEPLVKVSNAVKDAFDAKGVNIAQNNGSIAGQEVFHMHFHVTPIYDGNELEITYNRSKLEGGADIAMELKSRI